MLFILHRALPGFHKSRGLYAQKRESYPSSRTACGFIKAAVCMRKKRKLSKSRNTRDIIKAAGCMRKKGKLSKSRVSRNLSPGIRASAICLFLYLPIFSLIAASRIPISSSVSSQFRHFKLPSTRDLFCAPTMQVSINGF